MFSTIGKLFKSAVAEAPYLADLMEWLQSVQSGALELWLPTAIQGIACSDENNREGACRRTAVAICEFCRHPVCINHSFVGRTAQVVCCRCIAGARAASRGDVRRANPREQKRSSVNEREQYEQNLKRSLKVLGLKQSATYEQAKSRYKELALKHHEDRGGDVERMKAINVAFEWLKKNHYNC